MNQFFLGYITANDQPSFLIDYLNIKNMVRYHPGVPSIHVCIAVSEVSDITPKQKIRIQKLKYALQKAAHISKVHVIIKNNIGRDFSSAEKCLDYFSNFCSDNDYVLIRNRSGYGPFSNQWYSAYVKQNQKLEPGGLTGSTINQSALKSVEIKHVPTHIQTYVYLSQWKYFRPIFAKYPGAECTTKRDVIIHGELGLSSSFFDRGLSINCTEWEDYLFTPEKKVHPGLPMSDIKYSAVNAPIRMRYRRYYYRFWSILDGLAWNPSELFKLTIQKKWDSTIQQIK